MTTPAMLASFTVCARSSPGKVGFSFSSVRACPSGQHAETAELSLTTVRTRGGLATFHTTVAALTTMGSQCRHDHCW